VDVNVVTHPKDFKLTPLFKMGLQDVLQFSILSPELVKAFLWLSHPNAMAKISL